MYNTNGTHGHQDLFFTQVGDCTTYTNWATLHPTVRDRLFTHCIYDYGNCYCYAYKNRGGVRLSMSQPRFITIGMCVTSCTKLKKKKKRQSRSRSPNILQLKTLSINTVHYQLYLPCFYIIILRFYTSNLIKIATQSSYLIQEN